MIPDAETVWLLLAILVMADSLEQCRISKEPLMEVDCSNSNLDHIPNRIPSGAVSLNLSHNYIKLDTSACTKHSFEADQVVTLDLSFNRISRIHPHYFSCFTRLKKLDLSNNLLKEMNFLLPLSLNILNLSMNTLSTGFSTNRSLKGDQSDIGQNLPSQNIEEKHTAELANLNLLDISGNSIQDLNNDWLKGMKNLKQLYLQSNNIQQLQNGVFLENMKLEHIDVSQNNISDIQNGIFKHLENLKFLCLSGNKLRTVPSDLPSLEWLDISNNSIVRVAEASQRDLYQQEVLLLGINPFHCDCQLHWLKEYYDTREYQVKFLQEMEDKFIPICASPPNLANESWNFLSSDLFNCDHSSNGIDNDATSNSDDIVSNTPVLTIAAKGQDYVKLKWIMGNQYTRQSLLKYQLSFHQFGQRHRRERLIFHSAIAKYTLNGLESATAYIICLKEIDEESDTVIQDLDCAEIVTDQKPNEIFKYAQICFIVIFTIAFMILIRKITDMYFNL